MTSYQVYTPFSRVEHVGKGFIGDWAHSGYGQRDDHETSWDGDELVLDSENGKIKVFFADEPERPSEINMIVEDLYAFGPIGMVVEGVRRNITRGIDSLRKDETAGFPKGRKI